MKASLRSAWRRDHRPATWIANSRFCETQLIALVGRLADQSFRGITIGYDMWQDRVDTLIAEANLRDPRDHCRARVQGPYVHTLVFKRGVIHTEAPLTVSQPK
jgi:hypothetical protein